MTLALITHGCLQYLLAEQVYIEEPNVAAFKTICNLPAAEYILIVHLTTIYSDFPSVHSTKIVMNININHVIFWCNGLIKIKSNWIMFTTSLELITTGW